jgi:hypothetical protein
VIIEVLSEDGIKDLAEKAAINLRFVALTLKVADLFAV